MAKSRKKAMQAATAKSSQLEPDVEEVVEDLDEALEVIPYIYAITAYGADYPVDSVIKRMVAKDILVPTFTWEPDDDSEVVGFQREYVWPRPKADKFIESLLLGLPVPGIFLVHCCPVKSRTESTDCRCRINRYRSRTPEVPVKWAFSRKE
jgi:hypothetical protein